MIRQCFVPGGPASYLHFMFCDEPTQAVRRFIGWCWPGPRHAKYTRRSTLPVKCRIPHFTLSRRGRFAQLAPSAGIVRLSQWSSLDKANVSFLSISSCCSNPDIVSEEQKLRARPVTHRRNQIRTLQATACQAWGGSAVQCGPVGPPHYMGSFPAIVGQWSNQSNSSHYGGFVCLNISPQLWLILVILVCRVLVVNIVIETEWHIEGWTLRQLSQLLYSDAHCSLHNIQSDRCCSAARGVLYFLNPSQHCWANRMSSQNAPPQCNVWFSCN